MHPASCCHFTFVALLFSATFARDCAEKLVWNKKQSLSHGLQLQVCCNVTQMTIYKMSTKKEWTIVDEPIEISLSRENEGSWSEFQLSICNDSKEATAEFVRSKNGRFCSHPQGQVINIGANQFELNRWYVVCYQTSEDCSYCHFEHFCDNEYTMSCASMSVQSSARVVTNDSLIIWLKVGEKLPFVNNSAITVSIVNQSTSRLISSYTKTPQPGTVINISIEDLNPGYWYLTTTCLNIRPPRYFKNKYQFSMEKSKPLCKQGAYRTLDGLINGHARSLTFLHCLLLVITTCTFSMHSLNM